MPQIRFFPMDRSTEVPVGTTLSEAAGAAGISLRYDCGGSGTCGKCRIEIPGDRVGPDAQQVFRAVRACQTIVEGDLVCRIPADSLPAVRIQSVTDNRLRAGEPFAPVAATGDYGLALDIGTTTLALQLFTPELFTPGSIDPESGIPGVVVRENPQKRLFGDDIIARIQKVCDDPANLLAQQQVLLETLREMIAELAHVHRIDRRRIMRLCVAGNSVMELLLLGLDVVSLGSAPFEPVRRRFEPIPSRALGLDLHPEAVLEAFPLIGGFVGGDLTAGSVACGLTSAAPPALLLDIGTNGEMVLCADERQTLFATATAAGPAMEGACILHGMIAVPGAIEKVAIDPHSGDCVVKTIENRPAIGICGSGLVDAVAVLLDAGVLQRNGKLIAPPAGPFADRFVRPTANDASLPPGAAVVLVPTEQSGRDGPVVLTQRDIRQVQLAVGAIRVGIRLILAHADLVPGDLKTLFLAGGFGNYIDRRSARRIGLLPPELPDDRIVSCGNTSLAGAAREICRQDALGKAEEIAARTTLLDLSKIPGFATLFAESLLFPQ